MARHIALFVMSPYPENKPVKIWFNRNQEDVFEEKCRKTNEKAIVISNGF